MPLLTGTKYAFEQNVVHVQNIFLLHYLGACLHPDAISYDGALIVFAVEIEYVALKFQS